MELSFTHIQLPLLQLQSAGGEMEIQSSLAELVGFWESLKKRFLFPDWVLNQLKNKRNKLAEAEIEHKVPSYYK